MATEIYLCLDLGNDTLKASYVYEHNGKEYYGKLMLPDLINQVALPAAAFYDADEQKWKFSEELESGEKKNFSTVVKIKALMSLVANKDDEEIEKRNLSYYTEKSFFPLFSFPIKHKLENDFQYLVDQRLTFEVEGTTPQTVCEDFFKHIKTIIDERISELSREREISFNPLTRISIVYPPKQGENYTNELSRLIEVAFGVLPSKILTSTQAIGLLAFHRGLLKGGDRILFLDMGDETISVTKAWLDTISSETQSQSSVGILMDSPEGHLKPLEIGGSNLDESISDYLEHKTHERETVGSPSADREGHIFEEGLCSDQYLLMKDIKKAKMLMPQNGKGMFKSGIPISMHREILVQRLLTSDEFGICSGTAFSGGVAGKIRDYLLEEMAKPLNRDLTKVLFSGGMTETVGLIDYLRREISPHHFGIPLITFEGRTDNGSPSEIQYYEESTYAASLGGAVVDMKNYSSEPVLSYSYGTWLYHGNHRKHLKLFANRGSILVGDSNEFSIEAILELSTDERSKLEGDELFSTIITTEEMKEKKYHDKLVYEGNWLIIGSKGSYERLQAEDTIDLRVVSGGENTEIHFYHHGERVALFNYQPVSLYFKEGFVVDKNGHATPFFSNIVEKNRVKVCVKYLYNNYVQSVNAAEIEFRMMMKSITVATNT